MLLYHAMIYVFFLHVSPQETYLIMSPDPSGNRPRGVLPLKQELLPAQAFFLIDANNARHSLCSLPEAGRRFPGLRNIFPRGLYPGITRLRAGALPYTTLSPVFHAA